MIFVGVENRLTREEEKGFWNSRVGMIEFVCPASLHGSFSPNLEFASRDVEGISAAMKNERRPRDAIHGQSTGPRWPAVLFAGQPISPSPHPFSVSFSSFVPPRFRGWNPTGRSPPRRRVVVIVPLQQAPIHPSPLNIKLTSNRIERTAAFELLLLPAHWLLRKATTREERAAQLNFVRRPHKVFYGRRYLT